MADTSEQLSLLFVASECYPLIKTGGLADVIGALPLALMKAGVDARVLLPGFPSVLKGLKKPVVAAVIPDLFGGPAQLLRGTAATGLDVTALDAPHLYNLSGNPYMDGARERADNDIRFAALAFVGAEIARGKLLGWHPDIVHAHDWQAGLVAAYLAAAGGPRPRLVFTIHNLAFQGLFPAARLEKLGLPQDMFQQEGLEFWGQINFLKAGVVYSDRVTTVSPTYAREIQTEAQGMGLHGLLRQRSDVVSGIVNGIDDTVWNPESDAEIPAPYSVRSVKGKAKCKAALQARLGLDVKANAPLFCVVSRLTTQKGIDLILSLIPDIVRRGGQLAVLGSGDEAFEHGFETAAKDHPGRVATFIGYDEPFAHSLQAGADFILVPSRFEPCGLTQLCGLRYGTVPIVARVGGLADTIIDANEAAMDAGVATGIQFAPVSAEAFSFALERAFEIYEDAPAFARVQRAAMKQDVSWTAPAGHYMHLYHGLMAAD